MDFKLAVVVPVYKPFSKLDRFELISLTRLCKVLYNYDIYFVTHVGVDTEEYILNIKNVVKIYTLHFDEFYFKNISGYNKLLMNYNFYNSFKNYNYILICQLDVFVFSDMVHEFMKKRYDYIGAPWFEGFGSATGSHEIIGVGNGGFSLRNVDSFLSILNVFKWLRFPFLSFSNFFEFFSYFTSFLKIVKYEIFRDKSMYPSILPWVFPYNEDGYWSLYIKKFFPGFKIGTVQDAISFAFEVNPEVLYKLNGNKLPMAVHAWEKYDLSFWKPYIEKLGYSVGK
ncbi:DUF5672 family protein [Hymenobacter sp. BT491]|uniref:DUF5672 family protein n=1 Tax=Hymenobacter sp. BT491 TaxID=2766779 RepID=UPI0016537DC6|nr:DUF5672 family protein [Hymenobacter sp. BT491]MBC6988289.1 hypothetical protein [Hymenobacter sp. BT491]